MTDNNFSKNAPDRRRAAADDARPARSSNLVAGTLGGASPPVAPPNHNSDPAKYDCGCTEDRLAPPGAKHRQQPDPRCATCQGTGEIVDGHHYLGGKRRWLEDASETPEGELHVYDPRGDAGDDDADADAENVNPGWRIMSASEFREPTGYRSGRPRTTIHDPDAALMYLVDVANQVASEFQWLIEIEDDQEFLRCMEFVTDYLFALGKSASPRALEQRLPMSKATIYRRRKRGNVLLEQLNRIENQLEHKAAMDEQRWAELFQRLEVEEAKPQRPDLYIVPEDEKAA